MTVTKINSPEEMAQALGKLVFAEVERLGALSSRIEDIEESLLDSVMDEEDELSLAVKLRIFETMSSRRAAGQNFVLRFVQLFSGKGALDTSPEEERQDADMVGDLELNDEERKQISQRLRTVAAKKILDEHAAVPVVPGKKSKTKKPTTPDNPAEKYGLRKV